MTKYMVLYYSTMAASDLMASASPEEMKASMQEWIQWRDDASKTIKVDSGMPLQAVSRVTPEGLADSNNQASGYSIVEGESKEAVLELLKEHPHLKRPGSYIDVLEMLSMPGM
jgi:hypothetical protein